MDAKHVDMSRATTGAMPVLAAHDQRALDSVIGVVERAWLENGVGKAIVRFSADPDADKVFQKVKERILRNVSVGYRVFEYTDVSQRGDQIPSLLATKWQPQEISIVPIGFDAAATIRSADETNEVEIIGTAEGNAMKMKEEIAAEEAAKLAAEAQTRAAEEQEKATKLALETAREEATTQERKRVADITSAVAAAQLEPAFATELVNRGISTADAAKEIFKKLELATANQKRSIVDVKVTHDEKDTKIEMATSYLANRMNAKNQLDEKGKQFYGRSLITVAEALVERRLGETDAVFAARALTTSDLPNILANVAEKEMRAAYVAAPQSFKPFVKQGTLRNYKTANRLQLGDAMALQTLNEHGEIQMGSTSESKETIQVQRYMGGIAFTKEMLVNDDLSALANFASKFAQSAANLESDLVYNVLKNNANMGDGNALFSSAHANYDSSGAAISTTSIAAAWAAMQTQTSLGGNYLNLQPKYLIVAPGKYLLASQVNSTALLANQTSNINPYAGRLEIIVDARLSGNAWYMACDPSQCDTVELAKLEGQESPMVMVEQNFKVPGNVRIICEHNVGAAALDYRGLYKSVGA